MPGGTLLADALRVLILLLSLTVSYAAADLILHGGKIATVDQNFTIHQAIAISSNRIVAVGRDSEILRHRGPQTEVVNLRGKLVIPGLIDSHVHSADASMTEFDHPIPDMESIADVLRYIRERARVLAGGEWITVRQVFITRLKEQRYPTRAELDKAAPHHPVLFATGPDASLNTLALKLSGIDRDFKVTDGGAGFAEKDPVTGEPTGILRNCTRYVKVKSVARTPTRAERVARLHALFADYNSIGITSVCDRDASLDEIATYQEWRNEPVPNVRVHLSRQTSSIGDLDAIIASIRSVADDPLFRERDEFLRIIGVKLFLDGGMLTGSAYMREPWGVSKIYAITDPDYRGVRFIPHERLVPMIRAAVESGIQFTAHSVGDGAVHGLLDAYEEVNRTVPIHPSGPCISHSNFMSREALEKAVRLGVMMDIQPAWLYLDTRTLVAQFGYDRMRWFQPLRTAFELGANIGGGSDHMQKIGGLRSINPYNPFLGMATAITRKARDYRGQLHPEEGLTREQALRFYTINNARILRRDHELGSLEPEKLADFVILDTDILTCRESRIRDCRPLRTYVGGRLVYAAESLRQGL